MKIVLFGLGSIGQRHAQMLLDKYNHDLYAFRSGKSKSPNSLGIKEVRSWSGVKKINPDIAFITNPTSLHIKTAIRCAEIGCKIFIDKPLGDKLTGLDKLIKIIKSKKLVTMVGYNLRFHPVIKALKKFVDKYEPLHLKVTTTSYLPNWRRGTDYKKSYRTNKNMGGGVILDLSHEFDYINYLLGEIKIVKGQFSRRSDLTVNVEDYADVLINTKLSPVNLHINFLSHKKQRLIQIDFKNLTVIGDLVNCTIEEYKNEKMISRKQFGTDRNISFSSELEYFFKNIDNPQMMNNLSDASSLYKKIINFKNNG